MKRSLWMLSLCVALAGCAGAPLAPQPPATHLFDDAAYAPPTQRIDATQLFALSDAMRHYLDVEIAGSLRANGRQRGLVDALFRRGQLKLEYDSALTRTAAEAFDARAGNCLSLVLMTAALAKHLELPVQFNSVHSDELWSRSGDLVFVNGHVNILVAKRMVDQSFGYDPDARLRLDFLPPPRGAMMQSIGEEVIVAMFMNNRSAEAMARGQLDDAYWLAREALVQAPAFLPAYNTLGVVHQRHGRPALAEAAFRHVIERNAASRPALANLQRLLEAQPGREAEALALRERLVRIDPTPPFHFFDLGRAALRGRDYRAARELFAKEMQRDPDYHEFHFWIAIAYLGLGDVERARLSMDTAMRNSTSRGDHDLYAAKLSHLKALAATPRVQ